MYIESLEEEIIPWRKRWNTCSNINALTGQEYKGINQLLLTFIAYKNKYNDNRWMTYVQIKSKGYKLKDSKGKGVPIEFWSVYDIKNKIRLSFNEYEKIIASNPNLKENFRTFCNVTYVFNGDLIEGIPQLNNHNKFNEIKTNKYIDNLIRKLEVKYKEEGDKAFYNVKQDEIVVPKSDMFFDQYSYYATQLHELCHSTGNEKRLNRNMLNNSKLDYAREELIAEISSSFLIQKLNIDVKDDDYNNHKAYIQSWISLLKDKPSELFKAINEANKVCDYLEKDKLLKEKQVFR